MPILKFYRSGEDVALEKLRMEDITEDHRTTLLDRTAFICPKYRIDTNLYIAKNDLFFKMSKILNTSRKVIDAMLIREDKDHIIIVPNRSYVFWNGRSVEPEKYHILQTEENLRLQDQISQGQVLIRK